MNIFPKFGGKLIPLKNDILLKNPPTQARTEMTTTGEAEAMIMVIIMITMITTINHDNHDNHHDHGDHHNDHDHHDHHDHHEHHDHHDQHGHGMMAVMVRTFQDQFRLKIAILS